MEDQEIATPPSPRIEEQLDGAIYPENETPDEAVSRRVETAKSWEVERRERWEAIIEARREQL